MAATSIAGRRRRQRAVSSSTKLHFVIRLDSRTREILEARYRPGVTNPISQLAAPCVLQVTQELKYSSPGTRSVTGGGAEEADYM